MLRRDASGLLLSIISMLHMDSGLSSSSLGPERAGRQTASSVTLLDFGLHTKLFS